MGKHTLNDLYQYRALPLSIKISMTKRRIRDWVNVFGEGGVYVSFSGGKDSTVLLHICRSMYPNMKAMFVNTGLEFPQTIKFVKSFDNVDIVRPEKTFRQVVEQYGYPFISKEVARCVEYAKRNYEAINNGEDVAKTANLRKMLGEGEFHNSNRYDFSKYSFLLDAPFYLSSKCCDVMKKKPAKEYYKKTGRVPILGTMAEESKLRQQSWLQYGCNIFEGEGKVQSRPISFWTENDILQYLKINNLPLSELYGDIVIDFERMGIFKNQFYLWQDEDRDIEHIKYNGCPIFFKTTAADRTGCYACGFGCQIKGNDRFIRLKDTNPKLYEYLFRPWQQDKNVTDSETGNSKTIKLNGMNYTFIIDWINKYGDLDIKY